MMKKLVHILMLSCRKATELIDKKSVISLSVREKMMLRMHTGICDACAAYQKQSKLLDNMMHQHFDVSDESQVPQVANDELKQKIISGME